MAMECVEAEAKHYMAADVALNGEPWLVIVVNLGIGKMRHERIAGRRSDLGPRAIEQG